jgi:dienelactone hydrolase
MLARRGFGVLALDMRGYEGSEGSPNAFGWGATKDIDAAVAWLERRSDVKPGRIGGIGYSVGGEQMIEAAAENPGLAAVVSEGAGVRSIKEHLLRGPAGWFSLPLVAVQTASTMILSDTLPPPSLEDVIPKISPRAVFLIYAGHGGGGEELQTQFFDAARQPKELWRAPRGGHTGGYPGQPAEYERRVIAFFDQFLLKKAGREQ